MEASMYGSELVAAGIAIDLIIEMRYKLYDYPVYNLRRSKL